MRKLSKKERLVVRRLPDDLDPLYFYEYRMIDRSKKATGIEGMVYHLIPWSIIRSFAFAIDPLSNFKTSSGKISPVNRTRWKNSVTIFDTGRSTTFHRTTLSRAAAKNYQGSPGRYGPISDNPPIVIDDVQPKARQPTIMQSSKDTSVKTRPLGYDMGEFEKTNSQIFSPSRSRHTHTNNTQFYTLGPGQDYPDYAQMLQNSSYGIGASAATFPTSSHNIVKDKEMDILLSTMKANALSMYKSINPMHRNYSLFRNVVELRDLPRSILTLRETIKNFAELERLLDRNILLILRESKQLSQKFLKSLSSEYLSYNFGWKQLYKDTYELLLKPQAIQKQIDFLIRRNAKATTYRTKRVIPSGSTGGPGFSYDLFSGGEFQKNSETFIKRSIELRMVVNTTFSFPSTNELNFRRDLYDEKLGVYPRFTDLYNLTPWTWLIDWFTGLGNYVDIIDEINRDRSLINWGLITGVSSVDVTTNIVTGFRSYDIVSLDNVAVTTQSDDLQNHSSVLHFDLQLRKNVAGIFDVKTFSDTSNLTTYQKTILGALLAQRTKFKRS